jgi:hypothetical protein
MSTSTTWLLLLILAVVAAGPIYVLATRSRGESDWEGRDHE